MNMGIIFTPHNYEVIFPIFFLILKLRLAEHSRIFWQSTSFFHKKILWRVVCASFTRFQNLFVSSKRFLVEEFFIEGMDSSVVFGIKDWEPIVPVIRKS